MKFLWLSLGISILAALLLLWMHSAPMPNNPSTAPPSPPIVSNEAAAPNTDSPSSNEPPDSAQAPD